MDDLPAPPPRPAARADDAADSDRERRHREKREKKEKKVRRSCRFSCAAPARRSRPLACVSGFDCLRLQCLLPCDASIPWLSGRHGARIASVGRHT